MKKTVFDSPQKEKNTKTQKPKYISGGLLRTADIKKVLRKSDTTNGSIKLHTITQIIRDTNPSYRINYLQDRYNNNLLRPTKLTLDESDQYIKEPKVTHQKNW